MQAPPPVIAVATHRARAADRAGRRGSPPACAGRPPGALSLVVPFVDRPARPRTRGHPMAPTGRLREHAASPHDAELRDAAPRLARRRFLTVTAAAAALAFTTNLPSRGAFAATELDAARITADPFTLGVASGAPRPGAVLRWPRLAPAPFATDGGLGQQRVSVSWEVALDASFAVVVRRGTALAYPEYGHSVRVDVRGLVA